MGSRGRIGTGEGRTDEAARGRQGTDDGDESLKEEEERRERGGYCVAADTTLRFPFWRMKRMY